jgi:hypothetical protein
MTTQSLINVSGVLFVIVTLSGWASGFRARIGAGEASEPGEVRAGAAPTGDPAA